MHGVLLQTLLVHVLLHVFYQVHFFQGKDLVVLSVYDLHQQCEHHALPVYKKSVKDMCQRLRVLGLQIGYKYRKNESAKDWEEARVLSLIKDVLEQIDIPRRQQLFNYLQVVQQSFHAWLKYFPPF